MWWIEYANRPDSMNEQGWCGMNSVDVEPDEEADQCALPPDI